MRFLWRYDMTKAGAFMAGVGWKLWAWGLLLFVGDTGLFFGVMRKAQE